MSRKRRTHHLDPNETFLDSSNLPEFDQHQFEGRIEKPISRLSIWLTGGAFLLAVIIYAGRVFDLQIARGEEFAKRAEENRLEHSVIFGPRGIIYDRNGIELAWNLSPAVEEQAVVAISPGEKGSTSPFAKEEESPDRREFENGGALNDFFSRKYISLPGFSHVLGYVNYPGKDKSGIYYETDIAGVDGVEKVYNPFLASKNGLKLREVDSRGQLKSESVIDPPKPGGDLTLAIDSRVQSKLHQEIQSLAEKVDFEGGAGVIMDVKTGEILALTSYPEYGLEDISEGRSEDIARYQNDPSAPFLNRAIHGLYSPGSIVKPFISLAALNEGVISPNKQIFSAGKIVIPNPYHPELPSVFKDWKAHGWVDMRRALAVSSDVYFYAIGGGYQDQKGLGIARVEKYMRLFGFGEKTGIAIGGEEKGSIPSPEWKKQNFDGAAWLLGDTYHTAIGQYGFQVTPIQAVRAVAAVASDGILVTPQLVKGSTTPEAHSAGIPESYFRIVKEGMRQAVLDGTAKGLNVYDVEVAGKTGTAELGIAKTLVHSWTIGFFPYEHPRYAFAVVMEKGPVHNLTGATFVMRQVLDFMARETPEYLKDN